MTLAPKRAQYGALLGHSCGQLTDGCDRLRASPRMSEQSMLGVVWRSRFWFLLVAAIGVDAVESGFSVANPDPCEEIRAACRAAGFVEGAVRAGKGLVINCFEPIVHGVAQPRSASLPLPRVNAQWVTECRAAGNGMPANPGADRTGAAPITRAALPRPVGLVAVIRNKPGQAVNKDTIANPYIAGVALLIHWSDIEPNEEAPDWSTLDTLVSNAASARKWVQFLIVPGFFTPSWALAGVKTDQFPMQYGPDAGTLAALPMPWDQVYLRRWLTFIGKLSERYASSATVRMVAVAGPTSVSDEGTLPNSIADLKKWQADGYTPTKYLNAWKEVLKAFAADFPNQYLSLSGISGGLPINDMGKIDKSQHATTRQAVADLAAKILGQRFALQHNDLDGTSRPDLVGAKKRLFLPVNKQGGLAFVSGYIGRAVTGYMMRASAMLGEGMGDPGNPPPVRLKNAINNGTALNGAGQHVDFVEIWEPDILAADMQPVLQYGASLFKTQADTAPGCETGCR